MYSLIIDVSPRPSIGVSPSSRPPAGVGRSARSMVTRNTDPAPGALTLPVQVWLQNLANESCWAATYSFAQSNDGTLFKAKGP